LGCKYTKPPGRSPNLISESATLPALYLKFYYELVSRMGRKPVCLLWIMDLVLPDLPVAVAAGSKADEGCLAERLE
jgi:hypothetical protein